MYDKVKLWLDRTDIRESYPLISDYLTKAVEQVDRQTGETKVFGCLGGLKVSVYVSGVSVIGSLSKYHYPNSIYPLDRQTTKEALERLSDAFHTDILKADVRGIEFGTVLLLSHRVSEYLKRFSDMPYPFQRTQFVPETLYYKTKNRQQPLVYAFYDKVAEAKKSGLQIPYGMEGQNFLKYEVRFNGRLPKQLGVPEVKASTLYNKSFYCKLVQRWKGDYFKIQKRKQMTPDYMAEIKTVNDAYEVLVARMLAESGGDVVQGYIAELKDNRVFKNRQNYLRLRKKLQEVENKGGFVVSDGLIRELDDAIKNASAYL